MTALQQHLIKKLGPDAHALTVSVTGHAPHSVGLKPARSYGGSPLGVTYDLKVFPGDATIISIFICLEVMMQYHQEPSSY